MIPIILTSVFFLTSSLLKQGNDQMLRFKITHYNSDNIISTSNFDTIYFDKILDIHFYQKHFNKPNGIPKDFVNTLYKDTTVAIWGNPSKEKDYKENWTYTITYDSLYRVTKYTYSSCMICSQMPFNTIIKYDNKNKPIEIINGYGIGYELINDKSTKSNNRNSSDNKYELFYDEYDNIIEIKFFSRGELSAIIEKL